MKLDHYAAKHLKEIAFNMKVLLVEDDVELQKQLKLFLSRFVGKVDTAGNGIEALKEYKDNPYDLIITDLTMPSMGGIELAKKIHALNEQQKIIVISALSESDQLIELINIGIDAFLLKPLNMNHVLVQLNKTCQIIYEHKMLDFFYNMLEENNKELRDNNLEIACALNELKRVKNTQQRQEEKDEHTAVSEIKAESNNDFTSSRDLSDDEKLMLYTRGEKMSAEEFHNAYPIDLERTNEELEMLEDSFQLLLTNAERNVNLNTLSSLTKLLRSYATEIEIIPQFGALAYGIQQLAATFETVEDPTKILAILPMLASLFDNLEQWRRGIFLHRNVDDIHYLDNSLISDALSLQGILDNQHAASDDDIELF